MPAPPTVRMAVLAVPLRIKFVMKAESAVKPPIVPKPPTVTALDVDKPLAVIEPVVYSVAAVIADAVTVPVLTAAEVTGPEEVTVLAVMIPPATCTPDPPIVNTPVLRLPI